MSGTPDDNIRAGRKRRNPYAKECWYVFLRSTIFERLGFIVNKPMKAALLSAFVFPGVGHFFLKKYISGAILAGIAFAGLYFLIAKTVERALKIIEKIQSGEVQLDAATIMELASKQATATEAQLLNIAAAVLIISWLIGIFDAYRVGRAQDKNVGVGGYR